MEKVSTFSPTIFPFTRSLRSFHTKSLKRIVYVLLLLFVDVWWFVNKEDPIIMLALIRPFDMATVLRSAIHFSQILGTLANLMTLAHFKNVFQFKILNTANTSVISTERGKQGLQLQFIEPPYRFVRFPPRNIIIFTRHGGRTTSKTPKNGLLSTNRVQNSNVRFLCEMGVRSFF